VEHSEDPPGHHGEDPSEGHSEDPPKDPPGFHGEDPPQDSADYHTKTKKEDICPGSFWRLFFNQHKNAKYLMSDNIITALEKRVKMKASV
jgi:hypothetical protein